MKNIFFKRKKKVIIIMALFMLSVISIGYAANPLSSPMTYKTTSEFLDNKRDTVLALVVSTTVASNLVSAIPEDTGEPLMNQLSMATVILLMVQVTVFIEKYMMPIMGFFTCNFIVPGLCIIYVIMMFAKQNLRSRLRQIFYTLLVVTTSLYLITPISVKVSQIIEMTCKESVHNVLEVSEKLNAFVDDVMVGEESLDKGFWEKATDIATGVFTTVSKAVMLGLSLFRTFTACLVEVCVIFVVTTLLIPLAGLYIMWKTVKFCLKNIATVFNVQQKEVQEISK